MSGDEPDETAPFTHRPYGGGHDREERKDEPFSPPPGPPQSPAPTWETYQQPAQPAHPAAPYGAAPYGQLPYGAGMTPHPQANTAMILGIVAIAGTFVCGLPILLGPFAWAIGAKARREIDADPQRWGGRSEATAGYVLGIVTTVLLMLVVLVFVLLIGLAVSVSPS